MKGTKAKSLTRQTGGAGNQAWNLLVEGKELTNYTT